MSVDKLLKFAKQVGLEVKEVRFVTNKRKSLNLENFILAIINKVDPNISYEKEFVEWYESLSNNYFSEKEKTNDD